MPGWATGVQWTGDRGTDDRLTTPRLTVASLLVWSRPCLTRSVVRHPLGRARGSGTDYGVPVRMLDLFCGRWGWSKGFAARGWEGIGVDLNGDWQHSPSGFTYIKADVLTLDVEWVRSFKFVFACASSPCEEFSVWGMKHFHPHPKYPENGIKLFNHTREILEASGVPYVMENVRAAQQFVGNAVHHCGSFYLWGNAVPPLLHGDIRKMMSQARDRGRNGKRIYAAAADRMWSTKRKEVVATIPPELANCVADYAERLLEAKSGVAL